MTLEQTKDFNYWVGLTSSDGTNVSAKDRATFLTELKKRYFDVAKENMKISVLEQRVSALEIENEGMENLNKDLTEENVEFEEQIDKIKSDVIKYFGEENNVLVARLLKEWEIKENGN